MRFKDIAASSPQLGSDRHDAAIINFLQDEPIFEKVQEIEDEMNDFSRYFELQIPIPVPEEEPEEFKMDSRIKVSKKGRPRLDSMDSQASDSGAYLIFTKKPVQDLDYALLETEAEDQDQSYFISSEEITLEDRMSRINSKVNESSVVYQKKAIEEFLDEKKKYLMWERLAEEDENGEK